MLLDKDFLHSDTDGCFIAESRVKQLASLQSLATLRQEMLIDLWWLAFSKSVNVLNKKTK